jgi:hypothetical protein
MRYAFGPCVGCGECFGFDPDNVPSTSSVTGQRRPLCRACVTFANQQRIAKGMHPIAVPEDAYGPNREDELP